MMLHQSFNISPNSAAENGGGGESIPTGAISMWSTPTAPDGWLFCNGAEVSRNSYADLFGVIGTTFGAGNAEPTTVTYGERITIAGGVVARYTVGDLRGVTAGAQFTVTGTGNPIWDGTFICQDTQTAPYRISTFQTTQSSGTITQGSITGPLATTFNLPDTKDRTIRGSDNSVVVVGDSGGSDTTIIDADNLPQHRHGVFVPGTAMGAGINSGGYPNVDPGVNTIAGTTRLEDGVTLTTNSPISVKNRYLVLNYIIKH